MRSSAQHPVNHDQEVIELIAIKVVGAAVPSSPGEGQDCRALPTKEAFLSPCLTRLRSGHYNLRACGCSLVIPARWSCALVAVWPPDLHGRRRLELDGMFSTAACLAAKVRTSERIVAVTDVVIRRLCIQFDKGLSLP